MDESLEQSRGTSGTSPLSDELRRAIDSIRLWIMARGATLLCGLLLTLMSLNMLSVISRKSITADEIVMIPAAYYHLVVGNFHLVQEHPPLVKILAALPLLFIQPNEVASEKVDVPSQSPNYSWIYQEGFWEANRSQFERIAFWSRVPMLALTIALGVLIFVFARDLFGKRAAVLAVALFSLEPTVLAHGRVVQTDVAAAFGYLLFFFTLRRYLLAHTARRAALLGMAAGLAVLTKFSMLLVGPVLAACFIWMLWRAPQEKRSTFAGHAALAAMVLLATVHAAYFFHSRALTDVDARWIADSFPARATLVFNTVHALSYIFPTDLVLGVFWQIWHNGEGHPASLLGMHSRAGWWYYFPVAFALKTTIPFLVLSIASLAWSGYEVFIRRDRRYLMLLVPFVIYTAFVLLSQINIGVRYYLPAYPYLFIAGGVFLDRLLALRRARRAGLIAAVALVCWIGIEAVRAFPNQMTYMNQIAFKRPHWWYLSDSNVEWGDDARELALYLRARGETRVGGAFLGGLRTLTHYGVEYVDLLSPDVGKVTPPRYAAVGASFLNGSTVPEHRTSEGEVKQRIDFFDEYRHLTPEAVLGNSIYLYRLH